MQTTGNAAENWRKFKQRFQFYRTASGADKRDASLQVPLLLHIMGEEAIDIYNSFTWAEGKSKDKIDDVLEAFEAHFTPQKNVVLDRFHFNRATQRDDEEFDRFITRIKNLASTCEFGGLHDQMLRDRIVVGIRNSGVQERLLREKDLNLAKAVDICRTAEATKHQMEEIKAQDVTVSEVKQKSQATRRIPNSKPDDIHHCRRCGFEHTSGKCPAYGQRCDRCKGMNHFAKCCLSKQQKSATQRSRPKNTRKVRTVDVEDSDEEGGSDLTIDTVTIEDENIEIKIDSLSDDGEEDWIRNIELNGTDTAMKLDTGAQVNILSTTAYKALKNRPKIQQSKVQLKCAGGKILKVEGKCTLTARFKNRALRSIFYISSEVSKSLLSKNACVKLKLVKLVCAIDANDEYEDITSKYNVFEGLGCLPGEHRIVTDDSVTPTVHPCRKVPFKLQKELKKELKKMEEQGIITKIDEPTDWVNSLVIVKKKNGSLRVCLDPRDLNRAIKRQHFKLPTREEIMAQFAGATIFSKMDASQGFYQLRLDEDSSRKCTFNTPFGRYRYLRLPFGISSAPEVYSKAIKTLFEGIRNVDTSMDDIIVWGKTKEEHDKVLEEVLHVAQENNLRLNRDKCQFGVQQLIFLGDILSKEGIKPDPEKVTAINNMEKPHDKQSLQRFLGMITYLAKWIPHLSSISNPLRQLLNGKNEFVWGPEQDKAFGQLKALISSPPVLQFYDPEKPIKLSSDASKDGIGAVLLQKHDEMWKPVAYAARSMLDAETRYAQIEKELLGIVFACERFHQFIFGATVEAETDHKPLISLFKKPLNNCPIRVQRMLLRLQKYDLKVYYTPGKQLIPADTLSRSNIKPKNADKQITNDIELHVDMVVSTMPITDQALREVQRETSTDPELTSLMQTVLDGWPTSKAHCKPEVAPYWNVREQLSTADGILLKGSCIVIPSSMRNRILQKIHEGHMGIEKCRRRARQHVFWPNINAHITEMVSKCIDCQIHQNNNRSQPLRPHEVPNRPWQKIGADLFSYQNKNYLAIVDYLSGYPELIECKTTTSKAIITSMQAVFARFGPPDVVMSDNGPQFSSTEFAEFAEDWNFEHKTSSPEYPQSNGMAESAVKALKSIVKKSRSLSDVYKALLAYRTTPLDHGIAPATVMMGRNIRTTLPVHPSKLTSEEHAQFTETRRLQHEKQKMYFDKQGKKPLTDLQTGEQVRMLDTKSGTWLTKATITGTHSPRSYFVQASDGATYRRNREHLRPIPQPMEPEPQLEIPPSPRHDETASSEASPVPPVNNSSPESVPVMTTPRRSARVRKVPERLIEIKALSKKKITKN